MSDLIVNSDKIGHLPFASEQRFEFVEQRIDAHSGSDNIEVVANVLKAVKALDLGRLTLLSPSSLE